MEDSARSGRVERHVRLFNESVRRGDWTEFAGTFAPDAVMTFEEIPAGPFSGRDEIARAYADQPPSGTMTCLSIRHDEQASDTDIVRFAWDAGGTGTMRVTWRGDAVAALAVAFDR